MKDQKEHNSKIDIPFKGNRKYLHGTSFYHAVTETIETIYNESGVWLSRIVFRGFAKNECTIIVNPEKSRHPSSVKAMFSAKVNSETIKGLIVETDKKIKSRIEYNEDLITKSAIINEETVFQRERTDFSAIEEIVALTKRLHYHLIPEPKGKWVFSQLDLTQPFSDNREILYSIGIKQNLANKMTVSEVKENDTPIGKIRFTVAAI